jgi:Family of unknown function (DUF5681)
LMEVNRKEPAEYLPNTPGEAAPEQLPNASPEAAPEHLPEAPAEAAPERHPDASPEAAPEHLPDASAGAASEHLTDAPVEALPSFAVAKEALEAAPVLEPFAEQSAQKQRGRPFKPGQSGNPNGRPKGARNLATRAVEALIDGQAEALGAKAVEKALQGNSPMLRALLKMLVPPRRERTVEFELPKIESAADVHKASSAVITACADGELTPQEASQIMGLISTHVRAIEVAEELKARVAALEKKQSPSEKKDRIEDHPLYESVLAWENALEQREKAHMRRREERAARARLAGKTQ